MLLPGVKNLDLVNPVFGNRSIKAVTGSFECLASTDSAFLNNISLLLLHLLIIVLFLLRFIYDFCTLCCLMALRGVEYQFRATSGSNPFSFAKSSKKVRRFFSSLQYLPV